MKDIFIFIGCIAAAIFIFVVSFVWSFWDLI
jgi:hypothetical protein